MLDASEETVEQILAAALRAGFPVSRAQLHRWQQACLLPSPRQKGLGKARGTLIVYPAGTTDQLIELCKLLRKSRSLDLALWRLWWSGHRVPTGRVRGLLRTQVEWIREQGEGLEALDRLEGERLWQAFGKLERELGRARAYPLFRRIRRRIGIKDFVTFAFRSLQIGTGFFDSLEDYDPKIFLRIFGSESDSKSRRSMRQSENSLELEESFRRVSQMLDPVRLGQCLGSFSDQALESSRDELRKFFGVLTIFRAYVAAHLGPKNVFDSLLSGMLQLSLKDELLFFLLWLSISQSRELQNDLQSALEELQLFAVEMDANTKSNEPPITDKRRRTDPLRLRRASVDRTRALVRRRRHRE
jgi:hypothetical protein